MAQVRRLTRTSPVIAAVCLGAVGLMWAAVVAETRFERREAIAAAIERNANLAVAFEEFTVRTIDGADAVARYVRREYARSGERIDIAGLLADRTIDAGPFTAISIVDSRGGLVATSYEPVPGGPLTAADRPHFMAHVARDTGRVFVGPPMVSRLAAKTTIPISLRINTPDGAFGGIVSLQLEPVRFTQFYADATFRPGDVIALIGVDGITRARRTGPQHSSGERIDGGRLLTELAAHPVGSFVATSRFDGVTRFYGYRRLRDYPLIVAVGVAERDVLLPSLQHSARNYLGAALVSVATAVFAGLLITQVEREKRAVVKLERAMADLKAVDERLAEQASLLDKARDAIVVRDLMHRITYWNKSAERVYGWTAQEVLGMRARDLQSDPGAFDGAMRHVLDHGEWVGEMSQVTKDGQRLLVESRWTLVEDDAGRAVSVLVINTDITARAKLEQQFLRAQRLESIGTLAGGIAHDLNNVFTPIMMSVGLLRVNECDPGRLEILASLEASVRRGAAMVRQVLSFARGTEGRRAPVRLAEGLHEVVQIVNDTFLKTIDVRLSIAEDLRSVSGDPIQLHQVLLNLCVNARDAMPDGGVLTLSAENVQLDQAFADANLDAKPGPYVLLQVRDTGTGIPAGIIDRVFEPFFTTKDVSKGTGLGLSTSLAIVQGHGGFMKADSTAGHGATFSVYLPALTSLETGPLPVKGAAPQRGRGELILVVDDEAPVRNVTKRMLEGNGYRAVLASDGAEALAVYEERKDEIAAVITDMMMPVMDGPATIRALKAVRPDVRIIAVSGQYRAGRELQEGSAGSVNDFLPKPYTIETLLNSLKRVLSE